MPMARLFKALLRLPMFLRAQLTAFLTKFRSSVAAFLIKEKNCSKSLSDKVLSCQAISAIRAKAVRLTNSSFRFDQALIFLITCGVLAISSLTWSTMSQESKSLTQRSNCASVTFSGSSIYDAKIRASCIPEPQSFWASAWFLPIFLASGLSSYIEIPRVLLGLIPNLAIPATFLGLAIDFNFLRTWV